MKARLTGVTEASSTVQPQIIQCIPFTTLFLPSETEIPKGRDHISLTSENLKISKVSATEYPLI